MTDPLEVEKKFLNLKNSFLLQSLQAEEQSWAAEVHRKSERGGGHEEVGVQKTRIRASSLITSWQIDGKKLEAVTDFIFLDFKITVGW